MVAGPTDNSTQATYYVAAQHFTLGIATSGPCWVQITSPSSITPLLQGTQPAGTVQSFKADKQITLDVGSSAVVIGIYINGKNASTKLDRDPVHLHLHLPAVAPVTAAGRASGSAAGRRRGTPGRGRCTAPAAP